MVCKSRGCHFLGTSFMTVTPQPVTTPSVDESSSSQSPGSISNLQHGSDIAENTIHSAPSSVQSEEEYNVYFDVGGDIFPPNTESCRFEL